MRLLALAASLVASLGLHAQPRVPVYAVASVIGDRILVVGADKSVGSSLDRNRKEFFELKTPALDNGAVIAIDDALKEAAPQAKSILLGLSARALHDVQSRALDEGGAVKPLVEVVRPVAQKAGATHLILAIKARDDARIKSADGLIGLGKLEGLGFYVDNVMKMENRDTGESTDGFVAPFAYFRLVLVDLSSGAVLREQFVREAQAVSSQKAALAWDALAPEQKVRMLQQLIRDSIRDAVARLIRD
jgi:hypothetical protein